MSFIYILTNRSYEPHVLKIGKTRKNPEVRAKQLYSGKTGIPESFDVLFACEVPDCDIAESKIHKVFNSYRHNKRREFFRLPFEVAKNHVINICASLFDKGDIKVIYDINSKQDILNNPENEYSKSSYTYIDLDRLIPSPIGTSILSSDQKQRILIFREIFSTVFPRATKDVLDDFSRDRNPESEIKIWEHMAKAFMKIHTNEFISDDYKEEAYTLLLERTWHSKTNVLINRQLMHIKEEQAKLILDFYELKPKPLVIERR